MATTRREQILEAAMALFSGQGYHATSMRDIADRLGMQAGSLYVHIASKEDLLYEIVDRAAEQFLDAVQAAEAEADARRDADPARRLRSAMRAHLKVMSENLATATVFFHEWKFLDPQRLRLIRQRRDRYEAIFARILADGAAQGVFREDADLRMARLMLMSLCNWFYHWYSPDGPLPAEAIADTFSDLLLRGLTAAGGEPGQPASGQRDGQSELREALR